MPSGANAEQYVEDEVPFKEAKQQVIDAFESSYLKALLTKHNDNVTRSAQAAGLTRYHLRELAKRYGIRGVPTLVLFKDGRELTRCNGFQSAGMLRDWMAPHIAG